MEEIKKIDPAVEPEFKEEEFSFDFRTIFTLLVLNWQWFLLSMIICVLSAALYLRWASPVYQMSAKMLIKDEVNNRRSSGQMLANMQDLGFITNSTGIDNEVEILQSRILALEVVKDLKLYTEYRTEGRIKKTLVYKVQPVTVDMTEEDLEELPKTGLTMRLIIEGNNYQFEAT